MRVVERGCPSPAFLTACLIVTTMVVGCTDADVANGRDQDAAAGSSAGALRTSPTAAGFPGEDLATLTGVRDPWTLRIIHEPPPGGDGPTVWTTYREGGDGSLRPIDGADRVTAFARRGETAIAVDEGGRLLRLSPRGSAIVLTEGVIGTPLLAEDGERVFVGQVQREGGRDGSEGAAIVEVDLATGAETVLGRSLGSVAGLWLEPTGRWLIFVAAGVGGVAGLWAVPTSAHGVPGGGARCLTNCALRTGRSWGDAFVALPTDRGTLRVSAGRLWWLQDGQDLSVALDPRPLPPRSASPISDAERGNDR